VCGVGVDARRTWAGVRYHRVDTYIRLLICSRDSSICWGDIHFLVKYLGLTILVLASSNNIFKKIVTQLRGNLDV
jgi:hypothetical protein